MAKPKVVFRRSENNQWYFGIKGGNGENLATSETYTRRHGAERGFEDLVDAVLVIAFNRGQLGAAMTRTGIYEKWRQSLPDSLPQGISADEFVGQRPPTRPPRKPSPIDDLG